MVGFHDVVGLLLQHVGCARCELIDNARVYRRPVGRDLNWSGSEPQRAGEERLCGRPVTPFADQETSMTWPC